MLRGKSPLLFRRIVLAGLCVDVPGLASRIYAVPKTALSVTVLAPFYIVLLEMFTGFTGFFRLHHNCTSLHYYTPNGTHCNPLFFELQTDKLSSTK